MTNVDNRNRTDKGVLGAGRFAPEAKSEAAGVSLSGAVADQSHRAAVSQAASATGIYSGHAYEYLSTAMHTNERDEAVAAIRLNDGCDTVLSHNYATGITTYTCEDMGVSGSTDNDLIQVAVDDICREHEGDADGMFTRLRRESLAAEDLNPQVRSALTAA